MSDTMLSKHKGLDVFMKANPEIAEKVQIIDRDKVGFTALIFGYRERFDFPFNSGAFDEILDEGVDYFVRHKFDRMDTAQRQKAGLAPIFGVFGKDALAGSDFSDLSREVKDAIASQFAKNNADKEAKMLEVDRETAAQEAYEDHDFADYIVTDSDGWTRDGKFWSRKVYGDTPKGGRFSASFGIEFDSNTSKVADTWAGDWKETEVENKSVKP